MPAASDGDVELVGESLAGNRDAFRQIVERYQSLICSLAYSATGSLSQSEDLAQETFITAWKELPALREPAKLRPWLCGIVRCLIGKNFRRQQREPVYNAESLEEVSCAPSLEPQPLEQTISREEENILWRSLECIPEIYREPLVLFYRGHRSIEVVATDLELTEDAVKQRLSRGRKLLQEQVIAFVEGTLERTNPGKAFAFGVLAALPLLTGTAKAATAGTAAAQTSAMAKAAGISGLLGALLKFVLPMSAFLSLGGWLGYKMGGDATQSPPQREPVARFWGVLLASMVVFVLLPLLLCDPLMHLFGSRENFLATMRIWLDVMFALIAAALALWVWQRRKSRRQPMVETSANGTNFFIWLVVLATIFAASLIALGFSDSNWKVRFIDRTSAQRLISEKGDVAEFFVMQYQNGQRQLWIEYPENGMVSKNIAPADKDDLDLLAERGVRYPVYVQGKDFEVFGWQGKVLIALFLLVFAAGAAVLITLSLKNKSNKPIMTKRTQIGIVAAIILAVLIVTPLVVLNHRKVNTVHPNRLTLTLTTQQAAQATQTVKDFFDALGKGDWNKIAGLCQPGYALGDALNSQQKDYFKDVKVLSLGEPFKKLPYGGVYVPYHIRFKDGEEKNFNLAVRNDNPKQKWYFDGGF